MNLEYKKFELEIKEINEKGIFKGIASPFGNVDLGNDRVMPSVVKRNNNKTVPYLWQHDSKNPIGEVKLFSSNIGMEFEGKLYLDTNEFGIPLLPDAHKAYILMKNRQLKNSIGYTTLDYEYVTEGKKTIRNLNDIDIMEVSAVTFPMNPKATITDVKAVTGSTDLPLADRNKPWDGPAAEKRVLDFYRTEDGTIPETARRAFFWVDTSNPDIRASYKLGFADIIDGRLVAIPRAIIAVAGILQGARGGVDIPSTDKEGVKRKVATYYKKMDMTPPWEGKESVEDMELKEKVEALEIKLNEITEMLKPQFEEKTISDKINEFKSYIDLETKAGKKLSKASKLKIKEALEMLKSMIGDDEEMGKEEDKECGNPRKPCPSGGYKEDNKELELKSDELEELKNLYQSLKGEEK